MSLALLCTASIWWLAEPASADTPPTNDLLPTISGSAQEGSVLTADPGTWSGDAPITFSYQWSDGQTGSTATLSAADVGHTVTVSVSAANAAGEASATSDSVGPVLPAAPVNSFPPVVNGAAQQGATLSVSTGTWSNNPTGFSYAWEDCDGTGSNCATITGATSNTYTLLATDAGSRVVAIVTASNAGGMNQASSAATPSVLPAAPEIRSAPGIGGTPQQGNTLSVSTGTWSNSPTAFAYAWQDCGSTDSACSPISGATSNTYTLQASNVGHYVSVAVTASNPGGDTSVSSASVGPVLPPFPANTQAPEITGTAGQGDTLSVSNGTWSNGPTGFSYAWEACNASGVGCTAIPGATSNSYALSSADVGSTIVCVVTAIGPGGSASVRTGNTPVVIASPVPISSQPTTTDLLATPAAAVTNQSVTLIATVTAGASTALWGTVTFNYGGTAIGGCAGMPVAASGPSATVACSATFAASTGQLSATFTPTPGSILRASASPAGAFTVAPDASATSLDAPSTVTVGASTTYTATVTSSASRSGPIEPTGSIQFLDGGQPIASCTSQPLSGGVATCTVSYAVAALHQITASYAGDANFTGSNSAADQVRALPVPIRVLGRIGSTMEWAFHYTPRYTVVRHLVINGASAGATVLVRCHGHGCPFARHATVLGKRKRCADKTRRACFTAGNVDITSAFAGRHLAVGARITVTILLPSWIGKSYTFTVRAGRGPRIQIGCLAPGATTPGRGC